MAKSVSQAIAWIKQLADEAKVSFTYKALLELEELGIGVDESDICDVLKQLKMTDFVERLRSQATQEWLYVFKPLVLGERIYLKVAIRNSCLVISFHEDLLEEKNRYGEEE